MTDQHTDIDYTPPGPLNTAVLFLVFNRLDTTKKVFAEIRKARPPRIYVASDGPRAERFGEADKVKKVRDYIIDNIDWDCEVKTLFREQNLGCKYAVHDSIQWFFRHENQGIILEDDILPTSQFLFAMEVFLNKYKKNDSIAAVCGRNELYDKNNKNSIPLLTTKFWCWGWATWANRVQGINIELGYNSKLKK